jgi:hypothetical protein
MSRRCSGLALPLCFAASVWLRAEGRRDLGSLDHAHTLVGTLEGGFRARAIGDAVVARLQPTIFVLVVVRFFLATGGATVDIVVGVETVFVAIADPRTSDLVLDLVRDTAA